MPGRIIRTQTAQRVAQVLATNKGKEYLGLFGWKAGVPIVMTQASESLADAMGLASIHGRAVFIAMIDRHTDELMMLHLSTQQPDLRTVGAMPQEMGMGEFFGKLTQADGAMTFRVPQWKYSVVAHKIPSHEVLREVVSQRGYRFASMR